MNRKEARTLRVLLVVLSVLFAVCFSLHAQHPTFHSRKIIPVSDSILLDTLSIVPQSLILKTVGHALIADSAYIVDYAKSILILKQKFSDTLIASYRVFSFSFSKTYFNKDIRLIEQQPVGNENPFTFKPGEERTEIISFGSLNKSGSISRGIIIGNNQDLAVNSNLNLQLSGKLSEDVELLAAISDDNIPIQPDGNTQQIQDFDKVFIQLKNKNNILTAGDFELRRPDSYFMNFYKKAKGGYFTTQFSPQQPYEMKLGVAGAVSKGKYTRMSLTGQEGNQGPYRLHGNDGEQFFIVLSGSERVYIDGALLKRGEEYDYKIDYNTAELSFTAKRLITRYSRIVVEFEYSDKNYARSLVYFNDELEHEKFSLKLNVFSEQDGKNQPLLQSLDEKQKIFLQSIGDDISQAFYPNVDSVDYSPNEVLYKKIDTLGFKDIYVYSNNPQLAHFRVGFSQVGVNKGNYRQKNSVANGRVFEFIPPANGIPQGNFEPITLLITPKKSQLITLGGAYTLTKNTGIGIETAFSNNDLNLYSEQGNSDNQGIASLITLKNNFPLTATAKRTLSLRTSVSYEFVDKSFRALDFYRTTEFNRDFNITGPSQPKYEYLTSITTGIFNNETPSLNYRFSSFIRDGFYRGYLNGISSLLNYGPYKLSYRGSLLSTNDANFSTNFIRQKVELSKKFSFTTAGLDGEQERNRFVNKKADTLSPNSASFIQMQVYLQNPEEWINKYRLDYTHRLDYLPAKNDFALSTIGDIINLNTEFAKNPNSILRVGATYRSLAIESRQVVQKPEETILGRVEYSLITLKGLIGSTTFYEIGTGQEPKREFVYLEVPPGQGVFVHVDYNKNGIKELNEFEAAKFPYEANFVRIYIQSNEFVRSKSTAFSQTLDLDAVARWSNSQNGMLKLVSKFSNQTALQIDRKVLDNTSQSIFNPFDLRVIDSSLISLHSFIRNTVFFKRTDPVFGTDFNYQQSSNKFLLVNGFDTKEREEGGIRLRWNFARSLAFITDNRQGIKLFSSQFLASRNYEINFFETTTELSYQLSNYLRMSMAYTFMNQKNKPEPGREQNLNNKLTAEVRYNTPQQGSFNARLSFIKNKYTGESNTPVAYEMLDGLQSGNNLTWGAGIQKNLTNNLQLNFSYEGRKSSGADASHTGNVQASAFF